MMKYAEEESAIPYARRVFCNRNLRLDRIQTIGFDMDYTLAVYTEEMEHLQAEKALQRLHERYGYPAEILNIKYDPRFAVRGLVVDLPFGAVVKMDAHRYVRRAWHGTQAMEKQVRKTLYADRKITPKLSAYQMVDTLFAFPELCLYCQLIGLLFPEVPAGTADPRFEKLWHELRATMDELHRDGTLKAAILEDISRYIVKDDELRPTLEMLQGAGKRLFVLTNSEPYYTEAVMSYLLPDEGQGDWRQYFDIILASGRKPLFFAGDEPFYQVNDDLEVSDRVATTLERGQIYAGGNFTTLSMLAQLSGDEVLYVGDHLYGDILRSKRDTSWRTMMIVPEMERELEHLLAAEEPLEDLLRLEAHVLQLEIELSNAQPEAKGALQAQLGDTQRRMRALDRQIANRFNPSWGQIFRDRRELSAFGTLVQTYACVYSSRVSNLLGYSPSFYFRSPRSEMSHELVL